MKMHTSHAGLAEAFKRESCFTLDYSRDRMIHCLNQLSDEELWWRPTEQMNAVGNIVLHVCGNLRQWIVAGVLQHNRRASRTGPARSIDSADRDRVAYRQR